MPDCLLGYSLNLLNFLTYKIVQMKIVFLIANFVPHQIVMIKQLIKDYDVEIHTFETVPVSTFDPKSITKLYHYNIDFRNKKEILDLILNINPSLVVAAGWYIKEYVWISKNIRKKLSIPVVSYSDTQWKGKITQYINCLLSPFYIKKAFTHIWVSGIYQYEYARRLSFKRNSIIFNSLSCDFELFKTTPNENKKNYYPKNFIYIGHLIPLKGLEFLLQVWNTIENKKDWTITFIGNGPLKERIGTINGVTVKEFLSQEDLLTELSVSGCLILPSYSEQWGIVIHEAASAGLPIICTDICGAAPHFVIDGFNGYKVKSEDVNSLKNALENIISMPEDKLLEFSQNSRMLAKSIKPEFGAANLMSLITQK